MVAQIVKFKRIGTFLAYAIKDAYQFGLEENIYTMQSNLKSLMTLNGIGNQLSLSIFHGINSYSNLDLLELFELNDIMEYDIKECYENLWTELEVSEELFMERMEKSTGAFLEPSPCWNVSNFPKCKLYCDWYRDDLKNSFMKIGDLIR